MKPGRATYGLLVAAMCLSGVVVWVRSNRERAENPIPTAPTPGVTEPAKPTGVPPAPRVPQPTAAEATSPPAPGVNSKAEFAALYSRHQPPIHEADAGVTFDGIQRIVQLLHLDWDRATLEAVFWVTHRTLMQLRQHETEIAISTPTAAHEVLIEIPADPDFGQRILEAYKVELKKLITDAEFEKFYTSWNPSFARQANGWGSHPQEILVRFDPVSGFYSIQHRTTISLTLPDGNFVTGERTSGSKLSPEHLMVYSPFSRLFPNPTANEREGAEAAPPPNP